MPARFPPPIALAAVAAAPIAAGVGLWAWREARADQPRSGARPAASPFVAVAEGRADVEGGVIQVASRAAGVVKEVDVIEGDRVRQGQILARQEDDAPRLAVRTAEANLAQVRSQIGLTEVQLGTAIREQARLGRLKGVVSGQQIDQADDSVAASRATLASEKASVGMAAAQLAEARYRLEETIVRAPVDGVIVRRYANPGVGASTLNVTPMFDMEPAGARIVRAEVTESALPEVRVGQLVRITSEADQSQSWPGRVLRRAAVFGARKLQSDDPSERTDERVVEVVVSADGAPFLVGQRVLVKFAR